jgi:hypothetical protein
MVAVLPEVVEPKGGLVDVGGMTPSSPVDRIVNVEPEEEI